MVDAITKRMEVIDEEEKTDRKRNDLDMTAIVEPTKKDLEISKGHVRNRSEILEQNLQFSLIEEPNLKKIKEAPFDVKNKDMSIDLATISKISKEEGDAIKPVSKLDLLKIASDDKK